MSCGSNEWGIFWMKRYLDDDSKGTRNVEVVTMYSWNKLRDNAHVQLLVPYVVTIVPDKIRST